MASGSTSFANISHGNLSNMIAALDGMKKQGAKFYMNGAVHHYVRILTDDNGRPIFQRSISDPLSGNIMGYPYVETIKMPSTDASNTPFINFGNLKHFLVGRRLGSTTISTNPWGAWTTNRTWFKIYQRWALKIGLAEGLVRLITAST
jgi:HK97 family phage major capsid protein